MNRYEALQAFIQSQKTLLTRTQSDIQRLRRLRTDANAANSSDDLEELIDNLGSKVRYLWFNSGSIQRNIVSVLTVRGLPYFSWVKAQACSISANK